MTNRYAPCLRCGTPMVLGGLFRLLEGEVIVTREPFHLYVCPNCRKVEFYWADPELPGRGGLDDDTSQPEPETTACLKCAAIIPTGAERCPSCGWTWRKIW